MPKKNESFFKDLDEAKGRGGSCSCLSFAVLFLIIFILIEAGIFYFFKAVKTQPADLSASSGGGQIISDSSKIDLGENKSQITITQGGLCQKIIMLEGDKVRDLSCLINSDGIELSGKLSTFLPANSKVVLIPKVKDGKLEFEISRLLIGQVGAPKSLAASLTNSINSSLLKIYPDLDKVSVQSVELQDGVVLISARPK